MKQKLWISYIEVESNYAIVNSEDCKKMGIYYYSRIRIARGERDVVLPLAIVDKKVTPEGYIGVSKHVAEKLDVKDNDEVETTPGPEPISLAAIRKKMDGKRLTKNEIASVIHDVTRLHLSKYEIASWITALHINGMDMEEISNMTMAIVEDGKRIEFDKKPVFDFHSIGGVPGNKITPIVVSIVAAAGLMLPKTSTRSISSACGSIDFIELFCDPMLSTERIKEVAEKTGGCLGWGGAVDVSPADNLIIEVEKRLGLNPKAQMMASIMCKKLAIGATHLLIDIPVGSGTKMPNIELAREYATGFIEIGKRIGMRVECAMTYADQPVGDAIGPALEARECLRVLEGSTATPTVIEKSCEMAGIILEMGGIENGLEKANEILKSGKALEKFREIIEAENGDRNIKSDDIKPGKYTCEIKSSKTGFVRDVKNDAFVKIAKTAGAPSDKGAGLLILKKKGQKVETNDVLFEIYADSESKCRHAKNLASELMPFVIEGMLIERSI